MDLNTIIIELTVIGVVILGFLIMPKLRKIRQLQKEQMAKHLEKMEYYKTLTSEQFDHTPEEELSHAVLYHIMEKENQMYDQDDLKSYDIYDYLNDDERLVYTIYQLELSLEGGRGSVHTFFIDERFEKYRDLIDSSFRAIHCYEIAELMAAAKHLADIIEMDLEDEDDSDYSSYNFQDFTNELMSLLKSAGVVEKTNTYIKEHKESFIDKEGEGNEEKSSGEV